MTSSEILPSKLLINSRLRDLGPIVNGVISTTNTNDFTYTFGNVFRHIIAARLQVVSIPATIYNITSSNYTIDFSDTQGAHTCNLPPGQYTGSGLATQIGTSMTGASGVTQTFTCTYSSTTFYLTITSSNNDFTINFFQKTADPHLEMGFAALAYTSTTKVLTSVNAVSLEQPTIINVSIREFDDSIYSGTTGTSSTSSSTTATVVGNLQSSFLIRLKDTSASLNVKEFEADELMGILKFHAPKSFSKLHIQLKDLNNNLISLNNADWVAYLYIYEQEPYPHIGFQNWSCPCCRDDKSNQNKKRCNTCMSK